jgi:hypothetical protein
VEIANRIEAEDKSENRICYYLKEAFRSDTKRFGVVLRFSQAGVSDITLTVSGGKGDIEDKIPKVINGYQEIYILHQYKICHASMKCFPQCCNHMLLVEIFVL